MSILILAEHNNEEVKSSTLNTIGAASKISSDIEVLVVGKWVLVLRLFNMHGLWGDSKAI